MQADAISEEATVRRQIVHVSILLTIGLAVGVYLIGTATVVAQDGATFLEYAKNLRIAPTKTMLAEDQHPGYPLLILAVQHLVTMTGISSSPFDSIYSAQAVALTFRLLTIIVFYFLGRALVGSRYSFLAALALILLPYPAKFGSDALSDWPHMFFLLTGLFLLTRGALGSKWWLFGIAGISSGAGYLIRPECAQIVGYGFLWLLMQSFGPKRSISRHRVALASVALLVGFCVFAAPYMHLKKAVFPKKAVVTATPYIQNEEARELPPATVPDEMDIAGFTPSSIARGVIELLANISETVVWFLTPAIFIGLYYSFDKRAWMQPKQFFIFVPIVLNIALMMWLYSKYSYMSRRHTLPLVAFLIFFAPRGVQISASWICRRSRWALKKLPASYNCERTTFFLMFVISVSYGIPLLLTPLHPNSMFLRTSAQWLAENSGPEDIVAAPDSRISLYSGCKGVPHDYLTTPKEARYVVEVLNSRKKTTIDKVSLHVEKIIEDNSGNPRAVIYSQIR